jgi:hypothetical protein
MDAASAKWRNVNELRSDEYRVSYVEFKSSTSAKRRGGVTRTVHVQLSFSNTETEIMLCGARYMCRSLVWSVMHFLFLHLDSWVRNRPHSWLYASLKLTVPAL